jgi:hypothetical protein
MIPLIALKSVSSLFSHYLELGSGPVISPLEYCRRKGIEFFKVACVFLFTNIKLYTGPGVALYTWNPSYSGSRDPENLNLRPAQAKI